MRCRVACGVGLRYSCCSDCKIVTNVISPPFGHPALSATFPKYFVFKCYLRAAIIIQSELELSNSFFRISFCSFSTVFRIKHFCNHLCNFLVAVIVFIFFITCNICSVINTKVFLI